MLLQRYYFFSKSQRVANIGYGLFGCLCFCKDTNFLANHNLSAEVVTKAIDVYASAKILIFKQITT